jgi:hypothetical protein
MRGGCYVLALWLHNKTGLPLYGLWDKKGEIAHAFVYDPATNLAYDARGVFEGLEGIKDEETHGLYTGLLEGMKTVPASLEEMRAHAAKAVQRSQMRVFPIRIPSSERSSAVAKFIDQVPALARLVAEKSPKRSPVKPRHPAALAKRANTLPSRGKPSR